MTTKLLGRVKANISSVASDALYRGSIILLINTIALSLFGFVFWTLAARSYPAPTVGTFSAITSGVNLLAAIAALGLPNVVTRQIDGAENPRKLVGTAMAAIVTVGGALCVLVVGGLGPHLPGALHLEQRGAMLALVTVLVVVSAVSSTLDSGLIAMRSSRVVLIKNLVGSIIKVGALVAFASLRSSGLLISYSLGLIIAGVLSVSGLWGRLRTGRSASTSIRAVWHQVSARASNYLATVLGILPGSIVPIEVLVARGPAQTARFTTAFLLAGFLNFIPSAMAQVLFAEASKAGVPVGKQARKALRGIYSLLIPAMIILVSGAPLVLDVFGRTYSTQATGCLRVLALSALFTGGTYVVDSVLIARDRTAAYLLINGANAALVLGLVAALLAHGLSAAAWGWTIAQGISLVLGALLLVTAKGGRHRNQSERTQSRGSVGEPALKSPLCPSPELALIEPRVRSMLRSWPTMPSVMIAEQLGWHASIEQLLPTVTELRSQFLRELSVWHGERPPPGQIAECAVWMPPVKVPVGGGQTRAAGELPVLTMMTGYSRWLAAVLVPSRTANDLHAGLWELLRQLGAVPHVIRWDGEWLATGAEGEGSNGHVARFFEALGSTVEISGHGGPASRSLIGRAHAYLERSFVAGRVFESPTDLSDQLSAWLDLANTKRRRAPSRAPIELIQRDIGAMLRLPERPPQAQWRLSQGVTRSAYVVFDTNGYSVPRWAIGRRVEICADLNRVRVVCQGRVCAEHVRAWTRNGCVTDPCHGSPGQLSAG